MNAKLEAAHAVAMKADEAFHVELVRQFGKKNAGDARYRSEDHDRATSEAHFTFMAAMDVRNRMIAAGETP